MRTGRQLKRIIMRMAAVIILCGIYCISVRADDSIKLGMDQYRTEKGKVIIYVNHNKGENFNINTDDSCVVVGKQNLPIENIQKFKDAGEPVSYMFMVDVSGSMSKDRIDAVKDTLKEFIGAKKNGDNISISTMADDLVSTGFTEDAGALNAFVDGIALTKQDTDLYKSIKEELNILKTDKAVKRKRCLVIFSDGAEDQKGGITQAEAENMVKDTHIPVFTVALMPKNHKEKDIEAAKILGSFARYSAGGQHYNPQLDNIECKDVNGKIRKIIEDSLIVSADLAEVTAQDGNIYLGVELSEGKEKGKDGMEIPVGDILDAIKEAKEAKEAQEKPAETKEPVTPTPSVKLENKSKPASPLIKKPAIDTKLIIIACGVAAAIIIIITIIVVIAGSKKSAAPPPPPVMPPPVNNNVSRTVAARPPAPAPMPMPVPAVDNSMYSGIKVTLHRMGPNATEKYPLVLDSKKSIGRKSACDLSFENDGGLSGTHCYMFSKGNRIYVQDNNSTNGTFVNGVPIKGEFAVESGDILLIGSAEYRIVQD